MSKLSVVINTKNSAETLEQALQSVSFADEVVVVDMKSSDNTKEIAKKYTSLVFSHEDVGYVEPARNFAISKATGDWILILDSDEEVSEGLATTIQNILRDEEDRTPDSPNSVFADCYYLPRKNIIFGAWVHTGWWPDYVLRFFKKGHVEWSDEIHSIPITTGTVVELPAEESQALIHHNYQSVSQFITRLNRYTAIEAENKSSQTSSSHAPDVLLSVFTDEFLQRLFVQKGLMDGSHGMSLSLLQALYQLTTRLKLWERQGFAELPEEGKNKSIKKSIDQLRAFQRQLHYWIADWQVEHTTGFVNMYWRLRRKLQI